MKENQLEKYFKNKIEDIGGISYKFLSNLCAGLPDRIVLYKGDVFFVELKTEKNDTSKIQKHRHKEFAAHGVHVYVVHGKAEVDNFISDLCSQ